MEYLQYIKGQTPPTKLSEKYIKNHYPDFYKYLQDNYPEGLSFSERLYWFYNNITEYPVCPICGKRVKYNSFSHGYYQFCSLKCSNQSNEVKKKKKQTTIDNYGSIENSYKERIKKAEQTLIKHYGSKKDSYKQRLEKTKQTNLERYGVEYNLLTDDFQKQARRTMKDKYGSVENAYKKRLEKTKQTNLERYGVEYSFQSEEIQSKAKQTNLEKYGVENASQNKYIQEKKRQTNLEKYGVEYSFQCPLVKEKAKQTMLARYGVENAQQSLDIAKKSNESKRKFYINKYDNILDINYKENEPIYTCKCPHLECDKCKEKQFEILSKYYWIRTNNNIELCTKLLPIQNSHSSNTSIEIFIKLILDKHNIEYITNDRSILDNNELDIYIPSKKVAIECNGIYWHSTKKKSNKYHYDKFIECQKLGIQLLTIWEDQIVNKPDIIESLILSKLGIYKERIYARKCIIKEVDAKTTKCFLDNNHLQGNVNSSVKLGLYYNNELVSMMTFGKSRKCLNSLNDGYELYRFCNKQHLQVIGGASKLFKYFLKVYKPNKISSFASNDISNGGLYKILGFEFDSISFGSYWYIDKKMNRFHRYNFRKSELIKNGYDKNKSESEIMDEIGYYKIFDTGQSKFIYKN